MRPRIAMTTWRRPLPTFLGERTSLFTVADEYVAAVKAAGGTPILLPHVHDVEEADHLLDVADGLVLTGGGDVHPASYGAPVTSAYDTDLTADASERLLARRARERAIPTLGICRGMQIVAVEDGGTLYQDMTTPGGGHEPLPEDPEAVLAARHPIDVIASSRLAQVLGASVRDVNTIHHQAIDLLPDRYVGCAYARDGTIEAIEPAADAWPFFGVQWHPERMSGSDHPLFAWLVAEAAGYEGPTHSITAPHPRIAEPSRR